MAAELLGLFAAFPAQALSEAAAEARARHCLAAMAGFPLAAVRAAIAAWMRGEHGGAHDNHAFPPSPPQLARLARIALAPVLARIEALEALARAEVRPPPPSPESRARVAALAEAFRRGGSTAEDGRQRTDDGAGDAEDRRQRTDDRVVEAADGRRITEDPPQEPARRQQTESPSSVVSSPSSGSGRPTSA